MHSQWGPRVTLGRRVLGWLLSTAICVSKSWSHRIICMPPGPHAAVATPTRRQYVEKAQAMHKTMRSPDARGAGVGSCVLRISPRRDRGSELPPRPVFRTSGSVFVPPSFGVFDGVKGEGFELVDEVA